MKINKRNYKRTTPQGKVIDLSLSLFKDGDTFMLMDGVNLQESIYIGEGKTKREAITSYVGKSQELVIILDTMMLLELFNLKSVFNNH